jgi:gamma-D-glutamyl-L-lysine dipeptidyl-peptidase
MYYCNVTFTPLRLSSSHRSEMVSQLLLGEQCTIIATESEWSKIQKFDDGYEGYIETRFLSECANDFTNTVMAHDAVAFASNDTTKVIIPKGCLLPNYHSGKFMYQGQKLLYNGAVITLPTAPTNVLLILADAMDYLATPYLWGGRSVFGIDCSGFMQLVFKMNGFQLLRDASQQATQGHKIPSLAEALPGDLLFFENANHQITHVGLLLPNKEIIHSSGQVRIDKVDEKGIFNSDLQTYTHVLCQINRILPVS